MTAPPPPRTMDRYAMRARALQNVLAKVDRILLGDRTVSVQFVQEHNNRLPGWSQYPNIVINLAKFDSIAKRETIVHLLGLNYHELAHLMFTPRRRDFITKDLHRAWNILEDQRIESLFTSQYGPAGKYFTEVVVRFIVDDPRTWESAFPFVYGRSYLPLEIREEFEARYVAPDDIPEIKNIINKFKWFKAYHFRSKQGDVVKVVEEFQQLLTRAEGLSEAMPNIDDCKPQDEDGSGTELGDLDEDREKSASKKDRRKREKEEETGEDQSGFWEEDDEDEEDSEDGSSEDSEESDDSEPAGGDPDGSDDDEDEGDDGDSEGDTDDDSDGDELGDDGLEESSGDNGDVENDSDEPGDADTSDDGLNEAGSEAGTGESEIPESAFEDDEFEEYFDEIEDAVNDDEAVVNEVQQIASSISDPNNTDVIDFIDDNEFVKYPVTAPMNQSVTHMQKDLRRLYAEVEPGWEYRSDVGRLNVDRAMRDPENYEELYDEWYEGREHDVGLEVVILLDVSISMVFDGLMEPASQALWCIKATLDDVDAKTTVLGFDMGVSGLFSRERKVSRTHWSDFLLAGGGTEPSTALRMSRALLSASSMPNKILVVITDGEWGGMVQKDYVELVNSIDAFKLYVGLGDSADNLQVEEVCNVTKKFQNPLDLVPAVQQIVTQMLASRRR